MEQSEERLGRMQRTAEPIWGYGKYQCLGRNVAMIELNKVFFEVVLPSLFFLIQPSSPVLFLDLRSG